MSKKTPPLSDDSVIARAMLLMMLDHLDKCADLIEGCKNASERAEAVACLRSIIANVRVGCASSDAVVYVRAHEKGQQSSPQHARSKRTELSNKLGDLLEQHWFTLEKKPRQDTFVDKNYDDLCTKAYGKNSDKWIGRLQFKKRLAPSMRRKP